MRLILFLVLLAGIVLGVAYSWAITNFSGEEIGSWRIYDRPGPYKPVTVRLDAKDAPVRAFVDMQPLRNFVPTQGRTALTTVVTRDGKDILVKTLDYLNGRVGNKGSPQGPQFYRASIGDIDPVESGNYTFTIGPGDFDGLEVAGVDLILRRGARAIDWRIVSGGVALIAIGVFGLIRSRRRKSVEKVPTPPKWGR
ncbi:hypothetical protein GF108_09435 [Phyllobacterium sp. SYP-B3895]|uniref:hypothetical protein n=1 Tax=Phyllobacterium sp. SYP-B3895 TaxID=2663240 RepID=UPI001299BE7C|nr:hypothetical protein [Phyllobacterium sp. SYP-B3895]MRG55802.1 hypothetical protein [Phyllobacterium sp. SYP-B3895]